MSNAQSKLNSFLIMWKGFKTSSSSCAKSTRKFSLLEIELSSLFHDLNAVCPQLSQIVILALQESIWMPSWQVNNENFLLNPITLLLQFQLIFLSFIFSEAKSNPITVLTNSQHVQPSTAKLPTQPTQFRHLNQLDKFVYSLVFKLQLKQHNIFVGLCVFSPQLHQVSYCFLCQYHQNQMYN